MDHLFWCLKFHFHKIIINLNDFFNCKYQTRLKKNFLLIRVICEIRIIQAKVVFTRFILHRYRNEHSPNFLIFIITKCHCVIGKFESIALVQGRTAVTIKRQDLSLFPFVYNTLVQRNAPVANERALDFKLIVPLLLSLVNDSSESYSKRSQSLDRLGFFVPWYFVDSLV